MWCGAIVGVVLVALYIAVFTLFPVGPLDAGGGQNIPGTRAPACKEPEVDAPQATLWEAGTEKNGSEGAPTFSIDEHATNAGIEDTSEVHEKESKSPKQASLANSKKDLSEVPQITRRK